MKGKRLLFALYAGVIISDFITFTIGRVLRMGVLEPLRKRMNLQTQRDEFCEDDDDNNQILEDDDQRLEDGFCKIETPTLRKRDQILAKLESAGDYVGFVIRFSVGVRTPMMLLTGFSGRVSFIKYATGTMIGAFCSLSLQLLLGYSMRNNPAAVVGAVASISTFALAVPVSIAFLSWANLLWDRYKLRERV